ncbi:MAG: ABC transporter permease [Deltaproteobacteria bacterium]|nr:ABC transporter permease [Deltaproteobacteria bacterium]
MWLALAWRNLWRNSRRTLITVAALGLGVMAITFLHTYRESVFGQLLDNVTSGALGHLQVHAAGWQKNPELERAIADPAAVEAVVQRTLPGAKVAPRVLGFGLVGSGEQSTGAAVFGLDPAREQGELRFLTIAKGKHLGAAGQREALVGVDLAEQLGVGLGGEVVLVGAAVDGSVANDRYVVVGLADAGSGELNGSGVFLHLADAQAFFGLGVGVHQLVVRLPGGGEDVSGPTAQLQAQLGNPRLEVLSWDKIVPELKATMTQKRKGQAVLAYVLFALVALGVLNAMTMATLERTRELGVLASLGTRPRQLLGMILLEGLLQGALGVALGAALTVGTVFAVGDINLEAFAEQDMLGIRFPSIIHLTLQWGGLFQALQVALWTALVGSALPAWRAARMKPAEATRSY